MQFKLEKFFKYKFIEIYYNESLIEFPKSGQVENLNMIAYDLVKLKSSFDYSIERINLIDKIALRFLDYYDRAIFLGNINLLEIEKFLNIRHINFLLPEIFLNYYKSISTIIGDPSIDKDYQKRYKELGFNKEFFENTFEEFRKIRNYNDVSHYSLNDDERFYDEIKNSLPQIKNVASEVFERYLKKIQSLT